MPMPLSRTRRLSSLPAPMLTSALVAFPWRAAFDRASRSACSMSSPASAGMPLSSWPVSRSETTASRSASLRRSASSSAIPAWAANVVTSSVAARLRGMAQGGGPRSARRTRRRPRRAGRRSPVPCPGSPAPPSPPLNVAEVLYRDRLTRNQHLLYRSSTEQPPGHLRAGPQPPLLPLRFIEQPCVLEVIKPQLRKDRMGLWSSTKVGLLRQPRAVR